MCAQCTQSFGLHTIRSIKDSDPFPSEAIRNAEIGQNRHIRAGSEVARFGPLICGIWAKIWDSAAEKSEFQGYPCGNLLMQLRLQFR
jgi:hypothetical protein